MRKLTFLIIFITTLVKIGSASALDLIVATDQSLTFKKVFYEDTRNFTLSLVDDLEIGDRFALIGFGDKAKLAFRPLSINSHSDRLWLRGKVIEHFPKPIKKVTFYRPAFEIARELFIQWKSSDHEKGAQVLLIITDDKGTDFNRTLPEDSDINVPKVLSISEPLYNDYILMARIYEDSYITTRFLNIPAVYKDVAESRSVAEIFQTLKKPRSSAVDMDKEKTASAQNLKKLLTKEKKFIMIAAGSGLIFFIILFFLLIKNRRGNVHEEIDEEILPLAIGIEKDGEGDIEEIELKRGETFEVSSKLTADLFIDDLSDGFSLLYNGGLSISPLILSDGIEIINEGEPAKIVEGGETEEIYFGTTINVGDYAIKIERGENDKRK